MPQDVLTATWSNGQPFLNTASEIPVLGIIAGVTRMALAAIHIVGHLLAALFTLSKGHCFHAAKGGCEFLRGFIEATPFLGRAFAKWYCENHDWWIIKIYNPDHPDHLDYDRNFWRNLRQTRPTAYVVS